MFSLSHGFQCSKAFFLVALTLCGVSANADLDPKKFPSAREVYSDFEKNFPNLGPITTFFERRDQDPRLAACRGWLKTARAEYEAAIANADIAKMDEIMEGKGSGESLLSMISDGNPLQIPDGTIIAGDSRYRKEVSKDSGLMDLIQACGPCIAMVRIEKSTIYDSSGWCKSLPSSEHVVDISENLLKKWSHYPRRKRSGVLDGFNYILAFGLEDKLEPEATAEIASGDRAVIVVRAMQAAFLGNLAYGYYGDTYFQGATEDGARQFTLQFALPADMKNEELPGAYQRIKDPVTGIQWNVNVLRKEVFGRWFADSNGVLTYYTRADFGVPPIGPMKRVAHKAMLDASYHMYRKVSAARRGTR